MRNNLNEGAIAPGRDTGSRSAADRHRAESEPDVSVAVWSRLAILEQVSLLIANQVLRRQGLGQRHPTRKRTASKD